MDARFMPKSFNDKLAHLVEECGEVQHVVGKTLRFGVDNCNPDLPAAEQESNAQWLLRELGDLKRAIERVEDALWKV